MSAAGFLHLIRSEVQKILRNEHYGLELATVVSPYPSLLLRVDHMKVELSQQDLLICEKLIRHVRVASLKSEPGETRELGDVHAVDSNSLSGDPVRFDYIQFRFEDLLKAGDRVVVQAVPGGQKYVVIDRVVEYE